MNATYIISIARKLGCSIFLLPEDVTEVFLLIIGNIFMFLRHKYLFCKDKNYETQLDFSEH